MGLRLPCPAIEHETAHTPSAVARSRPFLVLVVAMSLAAFSVCAVVINLVPLLLTERGMTTLTALRALRHTA